MVEEAKENDVQELTEEQIKQLAAAKRQERIAAVERGIQDLCTAHRCTIEVEMVLSSRSAPRTRMLVIPLD